LIGADAAVSASSTVVGSARSPSRSSPMVAPERPGPAASETTQAGTPYHPAVRLG
jgi:hypothetical protein